jgi:hypothetical protein
VVGVIFLRAAVRVINTCDNHVQPRFYISPSVVYDPQLELLLYLMLIHIHCQRAIFAPNISWKHLYRGLALRGLKLELLGSLNCLTQVLAFMLFLVKLTQAIDLSNVSLFG